MQKSWAQDVIFRAATLLPLHNIQGYTHVLPPNVQTPGYCGGGLFWRSSMHGVVELSGWILILQWV
jgi:hypothetical protein